MKPCEHRYQTALADPGSALQLESLEKCGVKNACSVFSFFVEISGLATGVIRLPRQPWQRGHWSSMFPLKFLPTVGKSRRVRCWNEIPVVGDCFITCGVLQVLSKSFRESLKCNCKGTRISSSWSALGQMSVIRLFLSAKKPLSAFWDTSQSTPMSL